MNKEQQLTDALRVAVAALDQVAATEDGRWAEAVAARLRAVMETSDTIKPQLNN